MCAYRSLVLGGSDMSRLMCRVCGRLSSKQNQRVYQSNHHVAVPFIQSCNRENKWAVTTRNDKLNSDNRALFESLITGIIWSTCSWK